MKTFSKLFALYSDSKHLPSFDCTFTANLVLFNERLHSFSFFFGQDFGETDGRESLALSSIYRVDSLSDVAKLPTTLSLAQLTDCFERLFSDSETVVHSVAAVVMIIRRILPDYRSDSTVGNKLTRLF
jgi:hypothetical protein